LARPDELHKPGERRRQVPPMDAQRPFRIQKPRRDISDYARHGEGNAGPGGDTARIAERTTAARRHRVEHHDGMAVALKITGAADADDSGTNDDDLHRRGAAARSADTCTG